MNEKIRRLLALKKDISNQTGKTRLMYVLCCITFLARSSSADALAVTKMLFLTE